MKHMTRKKALSLFLSFIMIIASVPMALAASPSDFVDFPTGWSNEAVTAAVENGLLNGRSANTIEPQGNLTRAEMATIINRAFGATVEEDVSGYTDVVAGSWYYHEIAKAVNMETFQGDGDNTMRPDATITREEVFAVVARALVLETNDYSSLNVFADSDAVSTWAKKYAAILVAKGYVNGDDNGNLNPRANITREEFAQIMHNIIKTYYVSSGTYNTAGLDSVLIRTGDVKLENVTINGDLILGDGVGAGNVELVNVTIKGRLLARGGEGRVTLTNTKVGERVVVKDVNGFVNFFNYRTEAPFANILEITTATFRKPAGGNGGFSGGGSGGTAQTIPYSVLYYKEVPAGTVGAEYLDGNFYALAKRDEFRANANSSIRVTPNFVVDGYEMNTSLGYGQYIGTPIRVYANMQIKIYYDLKTYDITTTDPSGAPVTIQFKHGTKVGDNEDWRNFVSAHPEYAFVYDDNGELKEVTEDLVITKDMQFQIVAVVNVVFEKNDGSGEVTEPIRMLAGIDGLAGKLPAFTREGYTLSGWNTEADGSGTAYTEESLIAAGDSSIYAQWTAIPYAITYESSIAFKADATVPTTYDIETEVVLPGADSFVEDPAYVFDGWYKEAEYINKVTTIPAGTTGDIKLYARWLDVTVDYKNVTFDYNYTGAPAAVVVPVEAGQTVAQPADPERADYTFEGWYTDVACTQAYDFATPVDADITLYAKWTPVGPETKNVTFDYNYEGAPAAVVVPVEVGQPVAKPADPERADYTFGGWYTEAACETLYDFTAAVTDDITLYANWIPATVPTNTVTFNYNYTGAPQAATVTVVTGQAVSEPTDPGRTAYTFEGWYTDAACTQAYDFAAAVNADITLYAKWAAIPYSITFETNGGNDVSDMLYDIETPATLPAPESMSKAGYDFAGWYDNAAFDGNPVTEVAVGNHGDKTFYAKWDVVPYGITYDNGKGQLKDGVVAAGTYNIESNTITLPTIADFNEVSGYTFAGWYEKPTFVGNPVTEIPAGSIGDREYYAKWDVVPYIITYDFDKGQLKDGVVVVGTYNIESDTITLLTAADFEEVAGYEFKGWYDNAAFGGNPVTEVAAGSVGDREYYAKWDAIPYTITYDFGKGQLKDGVVAVGSYNIESNTITLPVATDFEENTEYVFKGWYNNPEFTGDPVTEVSAGSIGNREFYAKWDPIEEKVTVTFYKGVVEEDSKIFATSKVVKGTRMTQDDIIAALDRTTIRKKTGYTDGTYVHEICAELWYQKDDGTWAIFDNTVAVNSDMNVYYAYKNLSMYFDLKLGDISESINFSVPYETDTRIMDSIKDALTLGRNQVSTAVSANATLGKGDYYLEAMAKAGGKTGIIDAEGNLKYLYIDIALHEIIDTFEVEAEIKAYLENLFAENREDEKIDSLIHLAWVGGLSENNEFVKKIVANAVAEELGIAPENIPADVLEDAIAAYEYNFVDIKAYLNGCSEEERIALADSFFDELHKLTFYKEFIEKYDAEHDEFHVTHESVDLIMALASAVNDYTYEELADRIRNKFGAFIDIVGEDTMKGLLRDAQDRYYEGAHAVWEDVHAHDDDASYESRYPSYLTFKMDVIEHFFMNLYPANREKAINKFKTINIYHYADNPYLQQLIAATEADALLNALLVPVAKTEENIGYALWPSTTESGFMHYYDYALDQLKLFDKAMLWYKDNLTEAEMEVLKTKIFSDAATAANKANEMLDAYEEDGSLPLGININKLKDIDAFAKLYDKVEDKIVKALDKFKTTSFYGKEWNETNIRTDIPYTEEAVATLLGLDDPTFNIDTMMDKKAVFDKAGFVDYEYTGDNEAGTVTVQAIERILKENIARVRRYYQ